MNLEYGSWPKHFWRIQQCPVKKLQLEEELDDLGETKRQNPHLFEADGPSFGGAAK